MIFAKTAAVLVFLVAACAGSALAAAPQPRSDDGRSDDSRPAKDQTLLDRAALFRAAQVGECGSLTNAANHPSQKSPADDRPAKRAPQDQRKASATTLACNVVWSD